MPKVRNYGEMPDRAAYVDMKQSLIFDSEEIPEIEGWEIGGKYRLEVLVEMVSQEKDSDQEKMNSRFKVLDVQPKRGQEPNYLKRLVDPPTMKTDDL